MNYNCSNLLDMRNLQKQVKKAVTKNCSDISLFNCSSDLKFFFTNSRLSASNFKSFSRSLEQFFSQEIKTITNAKADDSNFWINCSRDLKNFADFKSFSQSLKLPRNKKTLMTSQLPRFWCFFSAGSWEKDTKTGQLQSY